MKPPPPEFSRPIEIDRIAMGGSMEKIAAEPAELKSLAKRLGLPAVHALSAVLKAEHWRRSGLKVKGQLVADVEQTCVVTLEQFRSLLTKPVERYYLPERDLAGAGDDESEEADADPVIDGKVDLGELVAETLILELDPYPRKPGAEFKSPDDSPDAGQSPFAGLSGLKGKV